MVESPGACPLKQQIARQTKRTMNLVSQLAKASAASPPKRVLGIDLGTTNSTVAQVQLPLNPAGSAESLCECLPGSKSVARAAEAARNQGDPEGSRRTN